MRVNGKTLVVDHAIGIGVYGSGQEIRSLESAFDIVFGDLAGQDLHGGVFATVGGEHADFGAVDKTLSSFDGGYELLEGQVSHIFLIGVLQDVDLGDTGRRFDDIAVEIFFLHAIEDLAVDGE